jgi:putative transposase
MGMLKAVVLFLRAILVTKACMAFEKLAMRQQLAVQSQSVKRPKLHVRDRFFWLCLSQLWPNWRDALIIVQPETVIKWHPMRFRLYWRWKSNADKAGRPCIEHEIRSLIRRMSRENPIWGAPRILSELRLLSLHVAASQTCWVRSVLWYRKGPFFCALRWNCVAGSQQDLFA